MHPTDHMSMAAVYSEQLRSSSGALYQRVTTYSVIKSVSDVVLASPKSPIFRSQLAFNKRLLGLRSLCKTFAECTYFRPLRNWYRKYCKNLSLSVLIYMSMIAYYITKASINKSMKKKRQANIKTTKHSTV
jgi:hypothetical protein